MDSATIETMEAARPVRSQNPAAESIFRALCFSPATLLMAALAGVVISLAIGGWPAFRHFGFGFLTSSAWNPVTEDYGAAGPVGGTIGTPGPLPVCALPPAVGGA